MITAPLVAFASLTLALAALWAPRVSAAPSARWWWALPCGIAIGAAFASGLVDVRGLLALTLFAAACSIARHADARALWAVAHAAMLSMCAALLLHIAPGFRNPLVLDQVALSPDSIPYTKYLNFDKGIAGLVLLGVYAPGRPANDGGPGAAFLWRFAVLTLVAITLSVAIGYVRWDPKLPDWWPLWIWSMVFLTALPEEALFRGVLQPLVEERLGQLPHAPIVAAVVVGAAFGIAHLGGGIASAALASVAGAGYGWIFATTRSIGAAIAAHAGLNTVHFLCFSYPSLVLPAAAPLPML